MWLPQPLRRQTWRQLPRIPHLHPVGKDDDLDKSVAVVIPVGNRIDDGFGNDWAGDFELNRNLGAHRAGTHASVNLAQDELHCLINDFKQSSFIGLLGCNGFVLFRAIKMEAMHLHIV